MKKMRPSEAEEYSSDDEISVGCPSPQPAKLDADGEKDGEVIVRDTAKLVMSSHQKDEVDDVNKQNNPTPGVRSFSILDILNHRPKENKSASSEPPAKIRRKSDSSEQQSATGAASVVPADDSPSKIMRPWDYPHLAHFQAAAAAAAGFLHPNRCLPFHPSPFIPGPPFGLQPMGFHPSFHPHSRLAGSASFGLFSTSSSGHLSPSSSSASPDYISAGGSSDCEADDVCSTSGHSATSAGSPLLQQQQQQQQRQKSLLANSAPRKSTSTTPAGSKKASESSKSSAQNNATNPSGTPLDALFQMTSKTFDGSAANGGDSSGSQTGGGHGGSNGALFSPRQQAKKKRKSRTAFTNHQIFELEKRFLYQKYLSPADRDEIALTLGLTNAQVITWFQNRRAKLKRDMEELKKDVESAKILGTGHHHHHHHHHHKAFIGAMDLNLLQKKAEEYNQAMAAASE